MKSQWVSWARDWGLTHHPQRNWMARDEWIVGARRNYLVKVGWVGEYGSVFYVLVRFPKQPDATRVREQLLQDPLLAGMAGGRSSKRSPLVVDAGNVLWRRAIHWRTPKPHEVQRWVEQLLDGLARVVPAFQGRCEECQASGVTDYVLEEGIPGYLCGGCQERLVSEASIAERKYTQLEANYGLGALYGAAAAAVGGAAWALLAIGTNRVYAIVAIGIAWLTVWAYVKGAGKIDRIGQGIGAILTLVGIALGETIFFAYHVHRARPEIPFRLDVGLAVFLRVLTERPAQLIGEVLFGLVGVWYVFRMMQQPRFKPKFERPGTSVSAK